MNNRMNMGTGLALALLAGTLALAGCNKKTETAASKPAEQAAPAAPAASAKGVGPIQSLELGEFDHELAEKGGKIFSGTCAACHKMEQRYVGPALAGVTKRRAPEWVMNMMLNPTGMTQQDPVAKALLGEYMTQMSVAVTQDEARALLEYFRGYDGGEGKKDDDDDKHSSNK